MPGGGELGRVGAQLGDQHPGIDRADPGDLVQPVRQPRHQDAQVRAVRGMAGPGQPARGAGRGGARHLRQELLDLGVKAGDLGVDRIDQPQVNRDLLGVDVTELAGQRLLQHRLAGLQPVVAQGGQRRE